MEPMGNERVLRSLGRLIEAARYFMYLFESVDVGEVYSRSPKVGNRIPQP